VRGVVVVSGVVGMTMSRSYDTRERITAETDLGVSGGNIYSYSLAGGYAANGNVTGFTADHLISRLLGSNQFSR
jgi:hypothetical protein